MANRKKEFFDYEYGFDCVFWVHGDKHVLRLDGVWIDELFKRDEDALNAIAGVLGPMVHGAIKALK